MSVSYKRFEIIPTCYQLHETRKWTVDIVIRRRGRSRAFSSREHCPDEQQAIERSLSLGRRIIDGEVPHTSIHGLG